MAFRGDLRTISLADIFQNIATNRLTGTLRIYNEQDERYIYFGEGEIRLYSPGKKQEDWITELLVKRRKLSQEQKKTVMRVKKKTRKLLKHLLEELEIMSREDFSTTLHQFVEEEIYDVFLWKNAFFEFQEGAPPPVFDEEIQEANIQLDSYSLIMEAARRVDEWERMSQKIGSADEIFLARKDCDTSALPPLAQDLLRLLDGTRRLEEVIDLLPHSRFDIFQEIYQLLEEGYIRPLEPEELFQLALTHLEEQKRPSAIRILQHLLRRQRHHLEARKILAEALEAENRPLDAASEYKVLAYQYLNLKDIEQAIRYYRRSVVLDPADTNIQEKLLSIYLEQNRLDRAKPAGKALAATYLELGLPKKAVQVYETLLQYENSPDLHVELAKTYLAANENHKALEHYLEAGRLFLKLNQEEQALQAYEFAQELDPSPKSEATRMVESIRSGRYHRRKALLRRLAVTVPLCALFLFLLVASGYELLARYAWSQRLAKGLPLLVENRFSEAYEILYPATQEYPWSLEAREAKRLLLSLADSALRRAETLEANGQFGEAYRLYTAIAKLPLARPETLQKARQRVQEWQSRTNVSSSTDSPSKTSLPPKETSSTPQKPTKASSPKKPRLVAERKALEEYLEYAQSLYEQKRYLQAQKALTQFIQFLEKQPPQLQNVILEKAKYLLQQIQER